MLSGERSNFLQSHEIAADPKVGGVNAASSDDATVRAGRVGIGGEG